MKLAYTIPASLHRYTPDFVLPNGIIIETKGIFDAQDRAKQLLVRAQWPDLDIRMVFQHPNGKINPGSKTTYGQWCDAQGIRWAGIVRRGKPLKTVRFIPEAWYREEGPKLKPAEVLKKGPLP